MTRYIRGLLPLGLLLISIAAMALEGRVQDFSGKVEILQAGRWTPVSRGTLIPEGTTISTGFNSFAIIDLGEASLEIQALSRMTLEELVERNGVRETGLFLRVGKLRATVERSEQTRQSFRVRSSVATAAVRGTSFEFDGFNLEVEEGTVQFINLSGQETVILAGEISTILTELSRPTSPLQELIADTQLPEIFEEILEEEIPSEEIEDFIEEALDELETEDDDDDDDDSTTVKVGVSWD